MKERKEKNYEYHFVNGETLVINLTLHLEGDFDWWKLLQELDRLEHNNDQTEKRRHCSLEAYDEDERLVSKEPDILEQILIKEKWHEIIKKFSPRELEVFDLCLSKGYLPSETANLLGVKKNRISNILASIRRKIEEN